MRSVVIGASGKVGRPLVAALKAAGHEVLAPPRTEFDLLNLPDKLPTFFHWAGVVYLCAAKTRFIDCEADFDAYRVNVDGPMALGRKIARMSERPQDGGTRIVYLSSEAVEKALHTNYGHHKAMAEMGLWAVGAEPVIARLNAVTPSNEAAVCEWLVQLSNKPAGVYRWTA